MDGIILVNKDKDYTSRDVVNIIGKKFKTKKVGHTGTLDPMATGVLIICIGKATKLVELITENEKEYLAEIILGINTDTLDITGNIIEEKDSIVNELKIKEVIKEMIGEYNQEVPIYSAVRIEGKKLYEYARNKEDVTLPKRIVNIKELELIDSVKYENNKTIFKIRCVVSKGTYIRSLIRDISTKLNTIGVMSELTRTRQGIFNINECYTIDSILNDNYKIIDSINVLKSYNIVEVDKNLENDIKNGKIIENKYGSSEVVFVNENSDLLAIYHTYEKDKNKIKPWKMFI